MIRFRLSNQNGAPSETEAAVIIQPSSDGITRHQFHGTPPHQRTRGIVIVASTTALGAAASQLVHPIGKPSDPGSAVSVTAREAAPGAALHCTTQPIG